MLLIGVMVRLAESGASILTGVDVPEAEAEADAEAEAATPPRARNMSSSVWLRSA